MRDSIFQDNSLCSDWVPSQFPPGVSLILRTLQKGLETSQEAVQAIVHYCWEAMTVSSVMRTAKLRREVLWARESRPKCKSGNLDARMLLMRIALCIKLSPKKHRIIVGLCESSPVSQTAIHECRYVAILSRMMM